MTSTTVYNTVYNSEGPTNITEGGISGMAFPDYPESNMETMFGPVLLPKIYAKGLSALEIASSGSIILSVNDFETLNISNDESTRTTTFQSESNYHLKFYPGDTDKTVQVADHTWTSETIDSKDYQVMRTSQSAGYMLSNDVIVTGKLDLAGETAFSGDVLFGGQISVAKEVYLNSNLDVVGTSTLHDTLSVGSGATLASTLSVAGETQIRDKLSVALATTLASTLSVAGETQIRDKLSVALATTLASTLSVGANVTMESELSVASATTLASTLSVSDNVTIEGQMSVNKEVYLASNLTVNANAEFVGPIFAVPNGPETNRPATTAPTGSIYFNSNTLRFEGLHDLGGSKEWLPFGGVIDIDSDTYITAEKNTDDDTLSFFANDPDTARMTMNSTDLSINLDTGISSKLSVGGAVILNNTLSVGNTSYFKEQVSIDSRLSVFEESYFADTVTVVKNAMMSSNLSVTGYVDVVDRVQLGSTLSVLDAVNFKDTLSVDKNTSLNSNLTVSGFTYNTGQVEMASTLSVASAVYLATTLSVNGNTSLMSELSVGGATKLADVLSVNGNTSLMSELSVGGATKLADVLSVNGNTSLFAELSVGQATKLASTLSVGGASVLLDTLSVGENTILRSRLSVGNDVELSQHLSVTENVGIGGTLSVNTAAYFDSAATMYINSIKDATNKDGSGTLIVDVETLRINGNLDVAGTYNTVDVATSKLIVEDKLIVLSTSSNYQSGDDINDGTEDHADGNSGGGFLIAGKPSSTQLSDTSLTSLANEDVWEKSLKWNVNDGMPYLGYLQSDATNDATYRDRESYWELKGGAFHLSADRMNDAGTAVETVKYGFRINANDELEIIKKIGTADSKRVAKFGITSAF